jgi:hypothetical protein
MDIQFLDRRADLLAPSLGDEQAVTLAIAVALAEDEARALRRPVVSGDGRPAASQWLSQARVEGLR